MKNKIITILFYISLLATLFYAGKFGYEQYQNYVSKKQQDEIQQLAIQNIDEVSQHNIKEEFPKINLQNVIDNVGPHVKSWIYVPNTTINEALVQGKTNQEYLYSDIYGNYNHLGSLFLDENMSDNFDDPVSYLFGHNTDVGNKFTDIDKFFNDDFFNQNKYFYLYKNDKVYKYEILSRAETTPVTPIYPYNKFTTDDFETYRDILKTLNVTEEQAAQLTKEDKIMLLFTCKNFNDSTLRKTLVSKLVEVINV